MQNLPPNLDNEITKLHKFVITAWKNHFYSLSNIENMDEITIILISSNNRTVGKKGVKTIQMRSTSNWGEKRILHWC